MNETQAIGILEKYIDGKDKNKPYILNDLYASNAAVTFGGTSQNTNFPKEIIGNIRIAELLSGDFNKTFHQVRTYYLSREFPHLEEKQIKDQTWIVLMRHRESGAVQAGTGYYNWTFGKTGQPGFRINQHHIQINHMLAFEEPDSAWLGSLQENLSYPWLDINEAIRVMEDKNELNTIVEYLRTRL